MPTPFPPITLASASPRRQQLLQQAGLTFTVHPTHVEESYPPEMPAKQVPAYLAEQKAKPLLATLKDQLVLAADTVVILNKQLLGKPADAAQAIAMLGQLSGNTHEVVSGICLAYRGRLQTFSELTRVSFRELEKAEIVRYVQEQHPLDKAGAYGIQDWIGLVGITGIEGDFYNVMGLPVCRLLQELNKFLSSFSFQEEE